ITQSDEYRINLVRTDFFKYLGRAATQSEQDLFVNALRAGATDEQLVNSFVASAEFFNDHKGSATTQAAGDKNWLGGAYQDILGRGPDATGSASFLGTL